MEIGIRSSRAAKFIAALLACTAHGALAVAVMQAKPPVQMDSAAGAIEATLGASFADMAAGSLSPLPPDAPTEAEPVRQITPPEQAWPAAAPEPPAQAVAAGPISDGAAPVEPTPAESDEAMALSANSDVVAAIAPEGTSPGSAPPSPVQAKPAQPETAHPAAPQPGSVQAETIEAEQDDVSSEAIAVSRRPVTRPDTLDVPVPNPQKHTQTTRKTRAPQRDQPQGNSDRNARAGQASGTQTARAASSGPGGRSADSGNAAASNYPGEVMRKLRRVSPPRLNARGSAVIAFRIGGSGGLAGLAVARSSGSAALDRAALRVVQSASPFPAPPSGARRSFSIEIKAR
ncbi:TonB family protein [Salipiger aestuarii]|uniref:TonB family protein n=1 Tax=Salipiger aestuarii TaxID=568098 RepID=UPI00123A21DD|nr:TonB family protein [Salipiger aestuarii]